MNFVFNYLSRSLAS